MDEIKKTLGNADFTNILGQDKAKYQLKSALLMGRNVIIVGPPGIGKTTLAKNVADLLPSKKDGNFIRVQGSPDLTSEDLLGDIDPIKALKYGPHSKEAFSPGKIFKADQGVLFFDEVNRAPARLQNALLQVLEEKTVTIGSYTIDFPANFIFIGTLNPNDQSTEPVSSVFLDRCDLVYMNYPEKHELEKEIVTSKSQTLIEFPDKLLDMMIAFVRELRENKKLEKKPSVRASIGLYERAQANAQLNNHPRVTTDDIKDALLSVLAHRIELKPSAKYSESTTEFLQEVIEDHFGELGDVG